MELEEDNRGGFCDDDDMEPSYIVWCCSGYTAVSLLAIFSLLLPPLMIYSGHVYSYCDDLFPPWLIIGAVLWYIEIVVFTLNRKTNKTMNVKKVTNPCTYMLFCMFSTFFLIWWVFGVGRIFGPARSVMRGHTPSDLGIYDDPMMEDTSCKLFMYQLPFWICMIPFFFIGGFKLTLLAFACASVCDPDFIENMED